MIVAVIPARGGSKRIPRKNIREFAGRPIIAYSIGTARESGLFDRVIVSTDDAEIAAVARQWGAETPFERPAELSDDHTGTTAVVAHALLSLETQGGPTITHACCIYPTAPLLTVADLEMGRDALLSSGKSYAFSIASFPFPIERALRLLPDATVDACFPEHRLTRSQDLEPAYHDAGQFYWGVRDAFCGHRPIFSRDAVGVVLPRDRVADIDTPEDWNHAELLMQVRLLRAEQSKAATNDGGSR